MFQDKVAIVLGASAEGGSGWEIARKLANRGAKLVVAARRLDGIEALARLTGALPVRCDAAEERDVIDLVDFTVKAFGRIDIAIMAAGVPVAGSIAETSVKDLLRATAANYFGVFYFLQHSVPHMPPDSAALVLTSVGATRVSPGFAAYGAAKAASEALVRYAALEFAPRRIRVNAIAPGLIESPMTAPLLSDERVRAAVYKEIPLGKGVLPEQIADVALDLVKPGSAITGQCILVDNGMSLRRPPQPEEIPVSAFQDSAAKGGY